MLSATSCFLLSFCFRKVVRGSFSESAGNYVNYFHKGTSPEPGGRLRGRLPAFRRPPGATHTLAAPGVHLVSSGAVSSCPFAYKFIFDPKTLNRRPYFFRRRPRPPPSPTLVLEGSTALPGTLPERGMITGGIYTTMPASGVMRE